CAVCHRQLSVLVARVAAPHPPHPSVVVPRPPPRSTLLPYTTLFRSYPGIDPYTTLPVAAAFFVVLAICMFNLINSRFGRACKARSEEHTSELQSRENLVCRRLLENTKHSAVEGHRQHRLAFLLASRG